VCYICWTMGSDLHLNQFKCVIVTDIYGNMNVKYESNRKSTYSTLEHLSNISSLDSNCAQTPRRSRDSVMIERTCDMIVQ
jgi:hypothetical protein